MSLPHQGDTPKQPHNKERGRSPAKTITCQVTWVYRIANADTDDGTSTGRFTIVSAWKIPCIAMSSVKHYLYRLWVIELSPLSEFSDSAQKCSFRASVIHTSHLSAGRQKYRLDGRKGGHREPPQGPPPSPSYNFHFDHTQVTVLAPSRHLSPFCAFISKLPFPLCDPYWSYPLPSPLFLPSCLTRASPVTFSLATDRSRFWSPLSLPSPFLPCPHPGLPSL